MHKHLADLGDIIKKNGGWSGGLAEFRKNLNTVYSKNPPLDIGQTMERIPLSTPLVLAKLSMIVAEPAEQSVTYQEVIG